MNRITLEPPELSGQTVTFCWRVEPPTALYRASEFTLRFPDDVDLSRVPAALWWTIALGCLSPHWPLLRPCRVHLPVRLGPGEAEVWLRLMDAEVATLESLRKGSRLEREVEIVESGPGLPLAPVPDRGRCATAFSGGKDSLVQAGLLTELTERPVLVTTTAPMPPAHDHTTPRRRHVMSQIALRRDVTHVEVESDFYANKIVTTGEGGMVTTNDEKLARVARRLRDHAFSDERHFWHKSLGFNYRMTNLQAAVGLAQTERLSELVELRRVNARRYEERLSGVRGLTLPVEQPGVRNVFWMYGVLVEDGFGCSRDELRRRLARQGIETRTFFIPIHLQPIYHRRSRGQAYPVAEALCRKGMYLPSGATLSEADIDFVADAIGRAQRGEE